MRYLLDTHTLLWALNDIQKIPIKTRKLIQSSRNEILVSAVSFWELSLKSSIGKLELNGYTIEEIKIASVQAGFNMIDLSVDDASSFNHLQANYHKDPFDRMLIWQAISHDIVLITKDSDIKKYITEGLNTIW